MNASSMFLTPEEVAYCTDKSTRRAQCKWLEENRWRFVKSATGRPIVARAEAERHLIGKPLLHSKDRPRLEVVR